MNGTPGVSHNTTGTDAERPPNFQAQGEQVGLGLTEPTIVSRFFKGFLQAVQEGTAWWVEFLLKNAGRIVVFFANAVAHGEDRSNPVFRELTDTALRDLTGIDSKGGHRAVGKQIMDAMTGGAGAVAGAQLRPSTAGAEAYMETVMQLAIEGHLEGGLMHALSVGFLEKFTDLDDILAQVLGVGRMSRAVMRPLLTAKVVTPMQWHTNLLYRPTLLGAGEVARQVARGRKTREWAFDELGRQGYTDDRIEALLNASRKFHSVADLDLLVRSGQWDRAAAIQHLKDQGWEEAAANTEYTLEKTKRIAAFERAMQSAAVSAFADRLIDSGTLDRLAGGVTIANQEKAQAIELAHTRRMLNIRRLSLGQVEAMVKSGVLNVRDYRAAAERDGYPSDDVMALELHLRWELDREHDMDRARAALEADRAAEETARLAAAAAKRLELEAERALTRRGRASDLERAYIRGLVPLERLAEVLAVHFDAETVGVLLAMAEDDRLRYVALQEAREAALQKAARRELDIGSIERAVMAHIVSVGEYRDRLVRLGFTAGDADVLAATLEARIRDLEAARRARDEAGTVAAARRIDLARFETLVRRGHRSVAQYGALLEELGFDAGSVAAMRELLELRIADDTAARAIRAAAPPPDAPQGVTLAQMGRAVLLGVATVDAYAAYLLARNYTADAQELLLALLRDELADAESARERREAATPIEATRELSLSTAARAARLGVLSPDAYVDRLRRAGYSEEDLAIELELLLLEISQIQAARAAREAIEADLAPRGLSLAELERAVKAGVAPIEAYEARAIELGYDAAAVGTLVAVLREELAQRDEARARRAAIELELAPRHLSLAILEAAVKAGLKSVEEYHADVLALGYGADDAGLLAALLADELEATGA